MSQIALKNIATKVYNAVVRDAKDFSIYGITDKQIGDFKTAIDNLKLTGPDSDWLSKVKIAVQNVNNSKDSMLKLIKTICLILKWFYGSQPSTFAQYQIMNISSLTNDELERSVYTLLNTLTTNYNDVCSAGIKPEQISELTEAYGDFVAKVNIRNAAIMERKANTEARNNAHVNVYETTVRFAEIGKEHWKDVSDQKYQDYVLFDTTSAKTSPPTPTNVETPVAETAPTGSTVAATVPAETKVA